MSRLCVLKRLVLSNYLGIRGIEFGFLLLGVLLCSIESRLGSGKVVLFLALILLGVFQSLLGVCLGTLCGVKIGLGSIDLCLGGSYSGPAAPAFAAAKSACALSYAVCAATTLPSAAFFSC